MLANFRGAAELLEFWCDELDVMRESFHRTSSDLETALAAEHGEPRGRKAVASIRRLYAQLKDDADGAKGKTRPGETAVGSTAVGSIAARAKGAPGDASDATERVRKSADAAADVYGSAKPSARASLGAKASARPKIGAAPPSSMITRVPGGVASRGATAPKLMASGLVAAGPSNEPSAAAENKAAGDPSSAESSSAPTSPNPASGTFARQFSLRLGQISTKSDAEARAHRLLRDLSLLREFVDQRAAQMLSAASDPPVPLHVTQFDAQRRFPKWYLANALLKQLSDLEAEAKEVASLLRSGSEGLLPEASQHQPRDERNSSFRAPAVQKAQGHPQAFSSASSAALPRASLGARGSPSQNGRTVSSIEGLDRFFSLSSDVFIPLLSFFPLAPL